MLTGISRVTLRMSGLLLNIWRRRAAVSQFSGILQISGTCASEAVNWQRPSEKNVLVFSITYKCVVSELLRAFGIVSYI